MASWFTAGAVGTQTRGSIIRPAAYCGVFGYKPSFGLLSRQGTLRLSDALDHVGVLSRDVDDAALLCAAMAGEDAEDPSTALPRRPALTPVDAPSVPPRLAIVRTAAWARADEAQKAIEDQDLEKMTSILTDLQERMTAVGNAQQKLAEVVNG